MYNKTMFVLSVIILASAVVTLLYGCGESGVGDHSGVPGLDDGSNGSTVPLNTNADTITIAGQVKSSGDGLSGVIVTTGGKSVVTDMYGYFILNSVSVSGTRAVVNFEKEGYASYSKVLHSTVSGESYVINAKIKPVDYSQSIIPIIDNTIYAANKDNSMTARIHVPANSLLDKAGNPVSDAVTAKITFGDPALSGDRETFPGDFAGLDMFADGAETPIESVVFADISFFDAGGTEITGVAHDKPVKIMLSLPEYLHMQYAPGDTIPWWSYNDKNGYWIREDADPSTSAKDDSEIVMADGKLFSSAKVVHFSNWNGDIITQTSYLKVKVINTDDPLFGGKVSVYSTGVTYNGTSYGKQGIPDDEGFATVSVKASIAGSPETAKLFAQLGAFRIYYDVMVSSEGDVVEDNINTPEGVGTVATLTNEIVLPAMGKINVTVIDTGGLPAPGAIVYSDFGQIVTTDEKGRAVLLGPLNIPVTLHLQLGESSDTVVTVLDTKIAKEIIIVYY